MEKPQLTTGMAAAFYAVLTLLAWLLGGVLWGLDLVVWHNWNETPLWLDAAIGTGVGLGIVVASNVLERFAEWARALTREFAKILGALSVTQAAVLAVASGVGEELFFRGFLQQILSVRVFSGANAEIWGLVVASLIFGLVHTGPDRKKFLPWTIMAIVMGFVLGWMYLYTGNVLAPILAHFTINFLNLLVIAQRAAEAGDWEDEDASPK